MFDQDRFIESCRAALNERESQAAVYELVRRAVAEPGEVIHALGEPTRGGLNIVYRAPDLTILNVCWGPGLTFKPHDHLLWAVIGIYTGREENFFYQKNAQGLTRHGMKALDARDTLRLGANAIHSVTNPLEQVTGAIHVYGGDLFGVPRSEWDPQTFEEKRFDNEAALKIFAESTEPSRVG